MSYILSEGKLLVAGRVIELPLRVVQVVELEHGFAVRLDVPSGTVFNRNVYLVDNVGNVTCQIAESPHDRVTDKPYLFISRSPDGELVASNWNGVDYRVDTQTGGVSPASFRR
jgi:hypothetical protein